jgi:hypothetical protein
MEDAQDDPVAGPDPAVRPLSRVRRRLIESAVGIEADDPDSILFQHSVFCQTGLPYRDPGPGVREWEREQGRASLLIEAGRARDPRTGEWIKLGLPFGPKPRLILAHLNAEALRTGCAEIEVGDTLTTFVKRVGLASKGRNVRLIKDQLARLSASQFRMAISYAEDHARQVNAQIVAGFDLWFPKDERQRVLWPSIVRLSFEYFASLQRHAVPLDERAIVALSHSALALDLYAWMAQRLHRVDPGKPAFVPWAALRAQFGWRYSAMFKFRQVFRQTLGTVCTQYRGARVELDDRGMTLWHSAPPVKGRIALAFKP